MTKRSLYWLLTIATIVAFAVPFIFRVKEESVNQTLNLSGTLISAICTVLTLMIALVLFNKFGVETPLIEKSSAKVFELLEEIKEINFSIGSDKIYFRVQMSDPFKYNKWIESQYGEKLVFSENYLNGLVKLFKISNNPFIPPAISEKMDKLQFFTLSFDVDEVKLKDYAKVQVVGVEKILDIKYGRFNMKDLTVFEFLTMLDDISSEIKAWIQSHSTIPVKLNL